MAGFQNYAFISVSDWLLHLMRQISLERHQAVINLKAFLSHQYFFLPAEIKLVCVLT